MRCVCFPDVVKNIRTALSNWGWITYSKGHNMGRNGIKLTVDVLAMYIKDGEKRTRVKPVMLFHSMP